MHDYKQTNKKIGKFFLISITVIKCAKKKGDYTVDITPIGHQLPQAWEQGGH